MKKTILSGILLILSLCACSPSEKEIQLTATQVAKEIFGTQTALAPTATFTSTSTSTNTPLPTPTPTDTPEPTNTPPLSTPTLGADGVVAQQSAGSVSGNVRVGGTWPFRAGGGPATESTRCTWELAHLRPNLHAAFQSGGQRTPGNRMVARRGCRPGDYATVWNDLYLSSDVRESGAGASGLCPAL